MVTRAVIKIRGELFRVFITYNSDFRVDLRYLGNAAESSDVSPLRIAVLQVPAGSISSCSPQSTPLQAAVNIAGDYRQCGFGRSFFVRCDKRDRTASLLPVFGRRCVLLQQLTERLAQIGGLRDARSFV
jgi:hypothetical protein